MMFGVAASGTSVDPSTASRWKTPRLPARPPTYRSPVAGDTHVVGSVRQPSLQGVGQARD